MEAAELRFTELSDLGGFEHMGGSSKIGTISLAQVHETPFFFANPSQIRMQ